MTIIYTLLLMSASGTIMYLLSSIFGKRAKHHVWQYAMLATSVVMLLIPIQKIIEIPRLFKITVPQTLSIGSTGMAQAAPQAPISAANIIIAVWIAGAIFFAARMIFKYARTSLTLRQITEKCSSDKALNVYSKVRRKLPIHRSITLRSSKYLNSPLLFGIFKPIIIIPNKAFSESELEMIFTHELTHYKHRDLWIALAASLAQCVHWFNPAVYFIGKSITEVCELFCDETVVKRLNSSDKKAYGNLILSVIEKELNSRLAYTTSMASAKNSIQKRLRKIVEFKMPTKASAIAGIMMICAFSVSSLTALGFEIAAEVMPEEIKQVIPIAVPTSKPSEEATPTPFAKTPSYAPDPIPHAEIPSVSEDDEASDITANTETPQPTEASEEPIEPERQFKDSIDISKGSVGFSGKFTEKGQSFESAYTFTSETDTTVAICASSGKIKVTDADTNEVVYDGSESDEKTARIPMKSGERWNVSVTSTDDGESNTKVYTYSYETE